MNSDDYIKVYEHLQISLLQKQQELEKTVEEGHDTTIIKNDIKAIEDESKAILFTARKKAALEIEEIEKNRGCKSRSKKLLYDNCFEIYKTEISIINLVSKKLHKLNNLLRIENEIRENGNFADINFDTNFVIGDTVKFIRRIQIANNRLYDVIENIKNKLIQN